ncbi:unnamed protein product [Rhizophagus irregularis]|nr:unnamed protein product [Rhizophagus irregularis]
MGYSNKQTAAEIYLDVPPTPTVKVSDNTLSEGLLPTVTIPLIQLSGATHRKYKDTAFAVLFCMGLIIMAIVGIVLLFITNSHELKDYSRKSMQTEYKLEPNTYLLVPYFIFMYLWTSAVLCNIQRVTISGIVSNWYFYRHELDRNASKKVADLALSRAITVSFGTVCLDGLILLFIQLVQYITGFLKKIFFLNCLLRILSLDMLTIP